MNFLSVLGRLVSPVTNTITKVNDNKTKIKERQIERLTKAEDKLAEWELIQAENARSGWRDDWFSIILSVPLVGAFIPPAVPFIMKGFEVLEGMPEFYQYWLAVAILSSFGIRAIKR